MVQAPSWWVEDFNWSSHSELGKAIKERDLHSCSHLLVLWLQVCKIVPLRDSITTSEVDPEKSFKADIQLDGAYPYVFCMCEQTTDAREGFFVPTYLNSTWKK